MTESNSGEHSGEIEKEEKGGSFRKKEEKKEGEE